MSSLNIGDTFPSSVIGVKLIKERVKDEYTLSTDYIKTEIPNKIELEDAIEIPADFIHILLLVSSSI